MLRFKYLSTSKYYPITSFKIISEHVVEVMGDMPFFPYGFEIYSEDKQLIGKYDMYKTAYRHIEGGLQYSDDHSVWIPTVTYTSNGGELVGDLVQKVTNYKYLKFPTPVETENWKFKGWEPIYYPPEGIITNDLTFEAIFDYTPTPEEELAKRVDTLEVEVAEITPYTETKTAYIGDTEVTFSNVAGNNLTVFAITESGKAVTTTSVMADGYIKVTFDALEEVAFITISLI